MTARSADNDRRRCKPIDQKCVVGLYIMFLASDWMSSFDYTLGLARSSGASIHTLSTSSLNRGLDGGNGGTRRPSSDD
jgi:hypothetical protein